MDNDGYRLSVRELQASNREELYVYKSRHLKWCENHNKHD